MPRPKKGFHHRGSHVHRDLGKGGGGGGRLARAGDSREREQGTQEAPTRNPKPESPKSEANPKPEIRFSALLGAFTGTT
jgi:hypothetical protein